MRRYMGVFFGGAGLPPDVFERWHDWSKQFEGMWVGVVSRAMNNGTLAKADPVITARLLLGECIWVSRWYRPSEQYSPEEIAETVIALHSA
jgi:hypothetical protein